MRKTENRSSNELTMPPASPLTISVWLAILLIVGVAILAWFTHRYLVSTINPIPSLSTPFGSEEPISTTIISPSHTPTASPTAPSPVTMTVSPTAQIPGIVETLPVEFVVFAWHNKAPDCENNSTDTTVVINGVEIFGGDPPYKIVFSQYNKVIGKIESPINGKVEFVEPVVADRDKVIDVKIYYKKINQDIVWNGVLRYKENDPECTARR